MIRKLFCAALVALGVTLDTYFYAFRFIADGLQVVVAIASGIALELYKKLGKVIPGHWRDVRKAMNAVKKFVNKTHSIKSCRK